MFIDATSLTCHMARSFPDNLISHFTTILLRLMTLHLISDIKFLKFITLLKTHRMLLQGTMLYKVQS